uniref:Protein KRI1 homolog n=1 Tax=Phlebotomus papatasi TaxID=29031 RepID=A0A1B0D7A2_PHLPP
MFDSDSNSDPEDLTFSTNAKFAKSYDRSRRKELLKKLKTAEMESEESSSESDDSEEADGFADEEFDKTFFSTLASIKARDPKIYQKDVNFFGEIDLSTRKRSKEDKPITIRDLERKVLVEHGGMFEENENKQSSVPVLTEEQKEDKKMFQKFFSDSDGEDGGAESLFKAKKIEEIDEGEKGEINPEIVKPIAVFWNDPNISKEEAYLRDYILKRRFKDDGEEEDGGNLSEDEADLEKQAEFEQKVNFRFEEPDQDFIKRFPRTIPTSVRNVDDKRKKKRAEIKERKAREKEERRKEIEKLKEMKKKEIEEKISKLKQVAGSDTIGFDDADLSDDFDPEEHDRKMQEIFNDEYYGVDEGEEKPECPDIEDLKVKDWDNYDPAEDDEDDIDPSDPHCDDPDFNMDCEYDPKAAKKNFEKEMLENSQNRKRRKRRSKFAEVLRRDKPIFNPEDEKTYSEYIDEYYKMDCEDVIGDVKCRFKYVETVPNDFGLTVEEILMAKNKELNKWASLKKAVQIRPKHVELNEVQQYQRRRGNWFLKKQILKSVYGEESEGEEDGKKPPETTTEAKLKQKNAKTEKVSEENSPVKKKKLKKKREATEKAFPESLPDNSYKDSVKIPKKKKDKLTEIPETESQGSILNKTNEDSEKKLKKKANIFGINVPETAETPPEESINGDSEKKLKKKEKIPVNKVSETAEVTPEDTNEDSGKKPKKKRVKLPKIPETVTPEKLPDNTNEDSGKKLKKKKKNFRKSLKQ